MEMAGSIQVHTNKMLSCAHRDAFVCNVPIVKKSARSQDQIGWRRFMVGMISKRPCEIQETRRRLGASYFSGAKCAQSLSIEADGDDPYMHSQWLVRIF